jgi:hypothetical protein
MHAKCFVNRFHLVLQISKIFLKILLLRFFCVYRWKLNSASVCIAIALLARCCLVCADRQRESEREQRRRVKDATLQQRSGQNRSIGARTLHAL